MSQRKCKHCAMTIPSDSKICPYCRKKQSSSFVVKLFLLLFALYVLGRLSVPSFDSYKEKAKQAADNAKTRNVVSMSSNKKRKSDIPKAAELSQVEKRQMFASIYNKELSEKGLSHSVYSTGDDYSTLLINKIRMSEDLIKGITTDYSFLSALKKIGFKKIEFCEPSMQGGSNCRTFLLNSR